MVIYFIVRFLLDNDEGDILISVPSTNLVKQMHSDFCEYETDGFVCNQCYEMASGKEKTTDKRVIIATWSMLYRQPPEFFKKFRTFICDESHQARSPVLIKIINNLTHTPFKFGFTGTLSGTKVHELQVKSWFGSIIKNSTSKELMDRGIISNLIVKCLNIDYSDKDKHETRNLNYQEEIDYLINHNERNRLIVDLALKQNKNTLVLFNYLRHGDILLNLISSLNTDKKIFIIKGEVDADERERIRHIMEENNDVILFATYGTLSVGVNIKNLHNIIFSHPFKARIRNLQSIGRGLRLAEGKNVCTLFDLGDNLSYKKKQNFTYKHFIHRLKLYEEENFHYFYEIIKL